MKVIDLLNKIANGEEVPKKIKWGVHNLTWYVNEYVALDELGKPSFFEIIPQTTRDFLNEEVEIIEKDEKIEHLDIYNCFHIMGDNEISRLRLDDNFKNISDKINEIIDYINKGE